MIDWQGKVAVVTGGGSGIGEAMARRFAREGMKLIVADIDMAAARAVAAAIEAEGGTALPARTDVSRQDDLDALAHLVWSCFGSADLVCANAGVVPAGRHRPVWDYPLEDWKWSLDVNLMGVVHTIRAFIPRMIEQAAPAHFVTTASVAGLVSGPGSAVYSTAKHGAVRVTEALYASLKDMGLPIGVTLLCPGLVNTRIYQSERARPGALRPRAGIAEETPELQAIAEELFRSALSPDAVAEQLFAAVQEGRFYAITSENYDRAISDRAEAVLSRGNPEFAGLLELSRADSPTGERR
jgi:NAD(P)-dependent dehydrogenase (short-subunit alcohol dehydrogenase family)